jgi:hypothetical protein
MGDGREAGSFSRTLKSLPPVLVIIGEWLREFVSQSDWSGSSRCHVLNRSWLNFLLI